MEIDMIDEQEIFENSLNVYIFSVQVLSHDAATQCEETGNYNTPREIQHDVERVGVSLLGSSACCFTRGQREKITALSASLGALPPEAIEVPHMKMSSPIGCITAMNHPAWEPLRQEARQLLQLLEPAIRKNKAYFQRP
jgi:hypothetical protein